MPGRPKGPGAPGHMHTHTRTHTSTMEADSLALAHPCSPVVGARRSADCGLGTRRGDGGLCLGFILQAWVPVRQGHELPHSSVPPTLGRPTSLWGSFSGFHKGILGPVGEKRRAAFSPPGAFSKGTSYGGYFDRLKVAVSSRCRVLLKAGEVRPRERASPSLEVPSAKLLIGGQLSACWSSQLSFWVESSGLVAVKVAFLGDLVTT